jgi:hypothetical protein
MAFAGGFAAAIWWARKNGGKLNTYDATRDATYAATDDATYAATYAATRDATYAATHVATDDATRVATHAATDDATRDATHAATHVATRVATDDATRDATRDATDDATRDATRDATHVATRDATYAATYDATHVATRAATYAATDDATHDATYDATHVATRVATDDATRDATRDATDDATRDATDDATRVATHAATDEYIFSLIAKQLGAEFGVSPAFMLQCAQSWYRMYQGGNMWSAWDSYITAFRDVLGLVLPQHEKYKAWEACSVEGGFRIMHEEFCIVCDRPEILLKDDQNRPHSAVGPSHRWRDGWSLYYFHGVKVPELIIEHPEQITIVMIETESNAEVRRVMMKRYGYERYMADCGAKVIEECPADYSAVGLRTARLLYKEVKDDEPICYVDMLNSTPEPDGSVKRYMIRVDPNAYGGAASKSLLAGMASTWRDGKGGMLFERPQDYQPVIET